MILKKSDKNRSIEARRSGLNVLYHYTSLETAFKILENKELWASRIQCMNDGSENQYLASIIKPSILEIEEFADYGEWGTFYRDTLLNMLDNGSKHPDYVISFSEKSDDLSQWRAYSGNGTGCAIGFEATWLNSLDTEEIFPDLLRHLSFEPCDYDPQSHHEMIQEVLQAIREYLESPIRDEDGNLEHQALLNSQRALETYHKRAASFKHPAFVDEAEWRIIMRRNKGRDAKYRTRKSLIVPYLTLPLDSGEGNSVIAIDIGPNPHPELNHRLMKEFVENNSFNHVHVYSSAIPYRDW